MADTWLKCTECKTDIPYGGRHYLCSVSTCKRSKMRLVFCSVVCWDSHLSTVRHREAWAEDAVAPSREAWQRELAAQAADAEPRRTEPSPHGVRPPSSNPATVAPSRRVVGDASPQVAAQLEGLKLSDVTDKDILIVVSKMKKYIKDRSGFNVSDAIAEGLSDHVRLICDDAIRNAARDERKTVLERDVPRARR
jgi:histone H3/H4